jgi:hypothetical protein
MRNGHRNRWTAEDDDRLRELLDTKVSVTLISVKLTRSAEAIRMRLLALQKGTNMRNPDA